MQVTSIFQQTLKLDKILEAYRCYWFHSYMQDSDMRVTIFLLLPYRFTTTLNLYGILFCCYFFQMNSRPNVCRYEVFPSLIEKCSFDNTRGQMIIPRLNLLPPIRALRSCRWSLHLNFSEVVLRLYKLKYLFF